MSGEQRPTCEIRQTRDVTDAEAARMSHFAMHAIFRETRRDPLYWMFKIFSLGAMVAGFWIFVDFAMSDAGGGFPVWSCIAVLIGIAAYFAMLSRARRVAARANHELHRVGNRYWITDDGLSIDRQGIVVHLSWRCMRALANYKPNLLVYIGIAQVAVLPKAACENQDVEGFSAELQRRWTAHRDLPQPEPST